MDTGHGVAAEQPQTHQDQQICATSDTWALLPCHPEKEQCGTGRQRRQAKQPTGVKTWRHRQDGWANPK